MTLIPLLLEHKGLYWSKIAGTEGAMSIEPDENYVVPIGKARTVKLANEELIHRGETAVVITYGRGVYWSLEACQEFSEKVEILDLRSINPLDEDGVFSAVKRHGKTLIVTEESKECTFALSLMGRIQQHCFNYLDAPIGLIGAIDTPAIPLNSGLEAEILPNANKVKTALIALLNN